MLLVTHDVDEAVALADRVLVLEEGRISHQSQIDAPRSRDRTATELTRLRTRLLAESGVDEEGT